MHEVERLQDVGCGQFREGKALQQGFAQCVYSNLLRFMTDLPYLKGVECQRMVQNPKRRS